MEILLVEDDAQLGGVLARLLQDEGHAATVCGTLAEAVGALASRSFDVVVVDWMLPDGDGLDLLPKIGQRGVPVLVLTARAEIEDRVTGLRAGADDYLTKPFDVEELLARVDALHRRASRGWTSRFGDLEIDRRQQVARVSGKALELTGREFALLARLADTPDECVSRAALHADVWRLDFDPGSGVIAVHVSRLREKLGRLSWMIETIRGQGFRLRTAR